MTNPIALALAGLILVALLADFLVNGGGITILLGRKIIDLVDWIAFWR